MTRTGRKTYRVGIYVTAEVEANYLSDAQSIVLGTDLPLWSSNEPMELASNINGKPFVVKLVWGQILNAYEKAD